MHTPDRRESGVALCGRIGPRTRVISVAVEDLRVFQLTMASATSRPLEYLEGLPGTTFYKLYQQPSTALAIFRRMLPDLGTLSCSTGEIPH